MFVFQGVGRLLVVLRVDDLAELRGLIAEMVGFFLLKQFEFVLCRSNNSNYSSYIALRFLVHNLSCLK